MEFLNVAVVEDEKPHADVLVKYITEWFGENGYKGRIQVFSNAEAFYFEWEENRTWDVLFLDIQMPGISGIELAKKIRAEDDTTAILFVTGLTDHMQEGYEVSALHYLIKPVDEEKLGRCMERIVKGREKKSSGQAVLVEAEEAGEDLKGERTMLRILPEKIVYIEALAHYTELHTEEQTYRVREGIGEWEKRLANGTFVLSHRSYLVNLLYIKQLGKEELCLDTGECLPLSRRKQKSVYDAFIRFYRREE
ncbi:MAG: LytTR family DNA-binding domain-containing protein [Roseburia sp.]|nr:LytTR family DNA-binding domain-containing protein [Roseburia sp.]